MIVCSTAYSTSTSGIAFDVGSEEGVVEAEPVFDVPDPSPVEPLFVAGAGEFVFEPVEPVSPLVEPVFVAGAGVLE